MNWIGQFDIDEYLIPMGNHTTILPVLDKLDEEDKRVVSFGSWRAWPRWEYIDKPGPSEEKFDLRIPMKHTMLQAYNCDRQPPGEKAQKMPAEKQIYKPSYVTQHFIHYSTATVLSEKNKTEYTKEGFRWGRAFPDPRQRFANELTEGLMIHTKAVATQDTKGWKTNCRIVNGEVGKGLCRMGIPWPKDSEETKSNATKDGWLYNCWVNEKVDNFFVPRLEEQLAENQRLLEISRN